MLFVENTFCTTIKTLTFKVKASFTKSFGCRFYSGRRCSFYWTCLVAQFCATTEVNESRYFFLFMMLKHGFQGCQSAFDCRINQGIQSDCCSLLCRLVATNLIQDVIIFWTFTTFYTYFCPFTLHFIYIISIIN